MLYDGTDLRKAIDPIRSSDRLADFWQWYESRLQQGSYAVERAPFSELENWTLDPETGNLTHGSGAFFSVGGLAVGTNYGPVASWSQPIMRQPEVGILGILVKEFGGVPHCLLSAKMEPGNINTLQLSPTVQATRSNYTRVHQGAASRYLDFFTGGRDARIIVDVLQSEHGHWFYQKQNRNMIVCTTAEVEPHEGYHWLTFDQISALLNHDNLINMSTRSVLACLPVPEQGPARRSDAEVRAWLNDARVRYQLSTWPIPLSKMDGWRVTDDEVASLDGTGFRIIGLRVKASGREVKQWSQPIIAPQRQGLAAMLTRRIDGVDHLLMHACVDAGHQDVIELGPTVSYNRGGPAPAFLADVLSAPAHRVRYDTLLSEEGSRLYHAVSRYMIVDAVDDVATTLPEDYRWLSVDQVGRLLEHRNTVNTQVRSLLACLPSSR
jgi:oxidase EvaA